jgi:hypothetical protein
MLVLKTRHFDRASGQIPRALADNRVFFYSSTIISGSAQADSIGLG